MQDLGKNVENLRKVRECGPWTGWVCGYKEWMDNA